MVNTEHTLALLSQAVWIMIFGMVIVFLFLSILIVVTNLSAKIIKKLGLDRSSQKEEAKPKPKVVKKNDAGTVAAIGAAVNQYRENQNK